MSISSSMNLSIIDESVKRESIEKQSVTTLSELSLSISNKEVIESISLSNSQNSIDLVSIESSIISLINNSDLPISENNFCKKTCKKLILDDSNIVKESNKTDLKNKSKNFRDVCNKNNLYLNLNEIDQNMFKNWNPKLLLNKVEID